MPIAVRCNILFLLSSSPPGFKINCSSNIIKKVTADLKTEMSLMQGFLNWDPRNPKGSVKVL